MELEKLMDGETRLTAAAAATEILGLTADSREVRPGYLFAALPGVKVDGARFVSQALKQGASAVLTVRGSVMPEPVPSYVPVITDVNPRHRLAVMAARFFARQPEIVAAVTGTNGKTSVAIFVRQIFSALGFSAASLGTVGITSAKGTISLGHTTPDPVTLHRALADLADNGVTHLAMEASSHGLEQFRLDGVKVCAAAFTNLTRDHLDYHETFDDYAYAKLRLFVDVLAPGGVAVINADADYAQDFEDLAWATGHRVMTVGARGQSICLVAAEPTPRGQKLSIRFADQVFDIDLPLAGTFQASNALVAAGLAIACGAAPAPVFAALEKLSGAKGRLEEVAHLPNGATVFVDYAHTPDALETVLKALRPHTAGRLVVVFGCGGDRDPGKRPQMGAIADAFADEAIVTDDNPRSENPDLIRAAILAAAPGAREIGDRAQAIETAMAGLGTGDVLVVAGKGHETGQIIGVKTIPFSDHDVINDVAAKLGGAS